MFRTYIENTGCPFARRLCKHVCRSDDGNIVIAYVQLLYLLDVRSIEQRLTKHVTAGSCDAHHSSCTDVKMAHLVCNHIITTHSCDNRNRLTGNIDCGWHDEMSMTVAAVLDDATSRRNDTLETEHIQLNQWEDASAVN